MKKTMIGMTMFLLSFVLLSCITINEVKSIALNWVPEEWYQRIDINTEGTPFAGKTITVTLDNETTQTKDLSSADITYTGSGVFVSGEQKYLERRYVGAYDVNIHYEGFTVSFEYFVDDNALKIALNNAVERVALNAVINDEDFLTDIGLGSYWVSLGTHSVWTYAVYYTRNALIGGNPNTAGVFDNAYEAQQIIKAAFLHGLLAGEAAGIYLSQTLFPAMNAGTFEYMDWDIMAFNLLDLWNEGVLTYMQTPGGTGAYPISALAAIYQKLFQGGAGRLLHPSYLPLPYGGTTYLDTTASWPGILNLDIDDDIAQFLKTQYETTPPDVYQTMGFAIISYLVNRYTGSGYFTFPTE